MLSGAGSFTQMTVVQITSAIFRPAVWKVIRLRKWPRQSRKKRIQKQDPLPRVPGGRFCGCGGWCNFHRWFRKYRSWRTDRNADISIFGRDTETTGNIPDHALLSVQHLLRTMGEWNYFHRVTATTNRTIAVDPSQIPYGSQSSDQWTGLCCRGLRRSDRTNCIDVYVATHSEAEQKGVFYTEVYLLQ